MKLKIRVLIAVVTGVTLLATVFVVDVDRLFSEPSHLTPTHAKVQYNFRQRNLQKTVNGSREGASQQQIADEIAVDAVQDVFWGENRAKENYIIPKTPAHNNYDDLQAIVVKAENRRRSERLRRNDWNPTVGDLLGLDIGPNATLWEKFHLRISRNEIYPENDDVVPQLLKHISTSKISHITQKEGGTQFKLIIEFEDGGHVLFKPMRFKREQQTLPNHFYFTDFERHNAEIAAYHLDKLLNFRRCVPVVGRKLNITKEIYALATGSLLKTFFISPDNNLCFHGQCSYYCDTSHALCGSPDMIEGSLAAYLPGKDAAPRKLWRHPWKRSYHKRRRAQWEVDEEYCDLVRDVPPYNKGRRILDLMDMSTLDFLMGNMDRHHYESFKMFGNNSAPIHLDHGRAFGKVYHDEMTILAPIYQCCLFRHSTLATLLRYHNGPVSLGEALRKSMESDPLHPVLWDLHHKAIDRRVAIILQVLRECVQKSRDPFHVVINDFH